MKDSRQFLESLALPADDPQDCPSSTKCFPKGGQYRIEIPSTQGPRRLAEIVTEAEKSSRGLSR